MADPSLLPGNATKLERDLSLAIDVLARVGGEIPRIATDKLVDQPDQLLPWLVYEYGLGELLPYIKDLRRVLREGIIWQRQRGTPGSLRTGLGWLDVTATLEEALRPHEHGNAFQLGLDHVPDGLEEVEAIIGVARISVPVRSRLVRMHANWDHGIFLLSGSRLSGLNELGDQSGVVLRPDWPKLSFRREQQAVAAHGTGSVTCRIDRVSALRHDAARGDGFILSGSVLSGRRLASMAAPSVASWISTILWLDAGPPATEEWASSTIIATIRSDHPGSSAALALRGNASAVLEARRMHGSTYHWWDQWSDAEAWRDFARFWPQDGIAAAATTTTTAADE